MCFPFQSRSKTPPPSCSGPVAANDKIDYHQSTCGASIDPAPTHSPPQPPRWTKPGDPFMSRRSRNETRSLFLEAGSRLLVGYSFQQLARPITIEKLCSEVGLTHGAFYFHWSSKRAFDADLLDYLTTATQEQDNADSVEAEIMPATEQQDFDLLGTSVRTAALATWDFLVTDPTLRAQVLMSSLDGDGAKHGVRNLYDSIVATYQPVYESWADSLALEPRPPFTWRKIALSLAIISEIFVTVGNFGFDARDPEDRTGVDGDGSDAVESVRSTYANVIMGLVPTMLRPIGGGDPNQADAENLHTLAAAANAGTAEEFADSFLEYLTGVARAAAADISDR